MGPCMCAVLADSSMHVSRAQASKEGGLCGHDACMGEMRCCCHIVAKASLLSGASQDCFC